MMRDAPAGGAGGARLEPPGRGAGLQGATQMDGLHARVHLGAGGG